MPKDFRKYHQPCNPNLNPSVHFGNVWMVGFHPSQWDMFGIWHFWRNAHGCPRFLLSGNRSKEFGMTKGQLCKGPGEVGHVQSTPGLQWKLAQKLGMESLRCTHEDSTTPQYVDSTYWHLYPNIPKVEVRRLSMAKKNMPTFCASSPIQKGSSFCPRLVLYLIFPSNRSYFPTSLSFPSRFSRCSLPKGVVLVVLRVYPIPSRNPYTPISAFPDHPRSTRPRIRTFKVISTSSATAWMAREGRGLRHPAFSSPSDHHFFSKSRLEVLEYLSQKNVQKPDGMELLSNLKMVCQTVKCCKCSQVQTCLDRCVQRRQEKDRAEHPAKFMCFSIQT